MSTAAIFSIVSDNPNQCFQLKITKTKVSLSVGKKRYFAIFEEQNFSIQRLGYNIQKAEKYDIYRAANPKWKQRGVFLRIFDKKKFAKKSFVILTGRMTKIININYHKQCYQIQICD